MTGQFLIVCGGTVTLLRTWSPDGQVQRNDRPWTVAELAPAPEALPRVDVMADLTNFCEQAVGRAGLQSLLEYASSYLQQSRNTCYQ
jgi:hypothetical protein